MKVVNIIWFRRDLRLSDNAALHYALKSNNPVLPIFIFDKNILDKLEDKNDRRVEFIYNALCGMQQQLAALGSSLEVYYDTPLEAFKKLLEKYKIEKVFANHDYEQYAIDRDEHINKLLQTFGASIETYKDQVLFEKNEVLKDDGKPYTVFTPYSNKWRQSYTPNNIKAYPSEQYFNNFYKQPLQPIITLQSMGFMHVGIPFPSIEVDKSIVIKYQEQRNFPAIKSTTHLGIHLRFGTLSVREVARQSEGLSSTFSNELIWRDFYHSILWHFPHVRRGESFRKEYDTIKWVNDEEQYHKWCSGNTGYPIVDAGMRELNSTGFMHNRVRMIVASFLTKHLLIDWRWGELYFAKKLLDYDYAANNGGWQWAAGSGCDAAPYFRVFNPTLQTEKFDKKLAYINKWIPELNSFKYPPPIINHDFARKRALEVYGKALKKEAV